MTAREMLIKMQDQMVAERAAFEARVKAEYTAQLAVIRATNDDVALVESFANEVERNLHFGSGIVGAVNGAMADVVYY